jgi:hypothetical protein
MHIPDVVGTLSLSSQLAAPPRVTWCNFHHELWACHVGPVMLLLSASERCGPQEPGEQEDIKLAHRLWLYMPFTHSEELQDQEVRFTHTRQNQESP